MILACETMRRRKPVETLSMHTAAWGLRPAFFFEKRGGPSFADDAHPCYGTLATQLAQRH